MIYLLGEIVELSPEKGIYWLSLAARMGFFHSIFNLGVIHKEGDYNQPVDLSLAEVLFQNCVKLDPSHDLSKKLLEETRRMISEKENRDKK